jgi:hypothetical protein
MSFGKMSFWANVSGPMSLGKCRMGKCPITNSDNIYLLAQPPAVACSSFPQHYICDTCDMFDMCHGVTA